MANLRVTYDPAADAAYIYLTNRTETGEGVIATQRVQSGAFDAIVDFGPELKVLGLEFLGASQTLPKALLDQAEILDADRSRPPGD